MNAPLPATAGPEAHARDLAADLDWLMACLQARLGSYFATPATDPPLPDAAPPPDPRASDSPYAAWLRRQGLTDAERLILLLALAPHLRPQLLDGLWLRNPDTERGFAEFGGVQGAASGAFLPSGETACFLLAGGDLARRLAAARLLRGDAPLARRELVTLADPPPGEPLLGGLLRVSPAVLDQILGDRVPGQASAQEMAPGFPARRVGTPLAWGDLVLAPATLAQLEEIHDWLSHGATLLEEWGMGRRLRPGYACLFHGPPGTGKTLSACLLGQRCGREVYRVDLSRVVSKYIGETEKNLEGVFTQAERRGWLLFFDEADALFGKRTRVADAHDRYANQEVSYLLQRVEDFAGVVILASNQKANIDDAFQRRFQSVVHFPMPRAAERLRIWREAWPERAAPEAGLDLVRLAERHELSGGTILNVVRHAALRALSRGTRTILAEDVEEGIRRELLKEGRAF